MLLVNKTAAVRIVLELSVLSLSLSLSSHFLAVLCVLFAELL